jgi:hyperosmotically inducible periplasmic protein
MSYRNSEDNNMKLSIRARQLALTGSLSAVLIAAVLALPLGALGQSQTAAPDNSAQNKAAGSTAEQQTNQRSDMTITQNIRKSITADKTLSTYAHNVKIITRNGMVTLKGPVKSEDEKQSIASKAVAVAGSPDMVKNDLTIAPAK